LLQKLLIKNYALIDHLQIQFEDGFSVITGETGSGKSILLGALGLILGERVDTNSIRNKEKKCVIEGVFTVTEEDHKKYFSKYDLDFETETIIRREIGVSGKSRAFINDTPVGLTILKEVSNQLVDIHSQHETLMINDQDFLINLMDSQHSNTKLLKEYREGFEKYADKVKLLNDLIAKEKDAQNQKDFLTFLVQEFEEYNLQELADSNIEEEYQLLSNAEDIKRGLDTASELLNGDHDQSSALKLLAQISDALGNLRNINSQFEELANRVNSAVIELEDIATECAQLSDSTDLDERKLQELEDKNSFINRLLHKHQLLDLQGLLSKYQELKTELSQIGNLEQDIEALEKVLNVTKKELTKIANDISKDRKKIALSLQTEAKGLLTQMNMKNAEVEFRFEEVESINKNGLDNIQLYVKTNLGGSFEPIKKVASGGETSRIMLAIKSLQSKSRSLPTIIFDEIDTGVSGEVAKRMGDIMAHLGTKMQVISITHLPQIAAKGTAHYKVFKQEEQDTTVTHIRRLDSSERQTEIAELLSGSEISDAALKNAEELLKAK
jgi:DNA repair protein RecN (Recombination protein N)